MDSRLFERNRINPVAIVATGVFLALFSVVSTYAQETTRPEEDRSAGIGDVSGGLPEVVRLRYPTPIDIRGEYRSPAGSWIPLNNPPFGVPAEHRGLGLSRQQPPQASRVRSTRRKVLGGIVGAVGGLFGGMFLGAAIEGDRCNCDDPGLVGALIGAPVGGVAGGILGYKFLF